MQVFECSTRMPKFPHIYESLAFEFIAMHFYFCLYILMPVIPILNYMIVLLSFSEIIVRRDDAVVVDFSIAC